jgi:hypothetical protein
MLPGSRIGWRLAHLLAAILVAAPALAQPA